MSKAYYNEFDPKAAAWLRELIKQGLIADGDVDERSITDVQAGDIAGYAQCHFFAGIGGWSYALRLAGIPDHYPIWTASLPCQPFSAAGKQLGKADERHLLPNYIELVKQCRPATQFGEQVASAISHGWACDLQAAMEAEDYAVGYHVLGAHSVGSYHQRQRVYWVAHSSRARLQEQQCGPGISFAENSGDSRENIARGCSLGNAQHAGPSSSEKQGSHAETIHNCTTRKNSTSEFERTGTSRIISEWADPDWIECRDNKARPIKSGLEPLANGIPARVVRLRGYGNAIVPQVAAEFISAFYDICL
jgi:DNA (cytosine-5)-methyltransferase 1